MGKILINKRFNGNDSSNPGLIYFEKMSVKAVKAEGSEDNYDIMVKLFVGNLEIGIIMSETPQTLSDLGIGNINELDPRKVISKSGGIGNNGGIKFWDAQNLASYASGLLDTIEGGDKAIKEDKSNKSDWKLIDGTLDNFSALSMKDLQFFDPKSVYATS